MTNTSLLSATPGLPMVQTLAEANNMAIAVPRQVNTSFSFSAPSFGVRASCAEFTSNCVLPLVHGIPTTVYSCSEAGYPGLPATQSFQEYQDSGLLVARIGNNSMVGVDGTKDIPSVPPNAVLPYPNPVPMALQAVWPVTFSNVTTWDTSGLSDAVALFTWSSGSDVSSSDANYEFGLFASCNLSFYNITVQQSGGVYELVEETLSDPAFAAVLWAPLLDQFGPQLLQGTLQASALSINDTDTLMDLLAAELARVALSSAAAWFEPTYTTQQALVGSKFIGQYPLAPVLTMFFLVTTLAIVLLILSIWIVLSSSSPVIKTSSTKANKAPTVLELTQLRLTNPLALAAQLFAKIPESSFQPDTTKMFEADNQDATVGIGLLEKEGQQWFQVYDLNEEEHKVLVTSSGESSRSAEA